MAQAVGTAAAICKEQGIMPRQLANNKALVKRLQDTLQRDGQFLIGIKEDVGFAKDAKVTASSYTKPENAECERWQTMENPHLQALPLDGDTFESVEIYIKNPTGTDDVLVCKINESELPGAYNADRELAVCNIPVKAGFEGWVKIEAPLSGIKNNRVVLYFDTSERLQLGLSTKRVMGAPLQFIDLYGFIAGEIKQRREGYVAPDGGKETVDLCLTFKNLKCADNIYVPENVINGWSRPYMGANMWSCEDEKPWLSLKWDTAIDVSEIQLVHNAQIETDHFCRPIKTIIRDYDVILVTDSGEDKIEIRDNFLGLNKIAVSKNGVKEIRFEFKANYGSPRTEVFGVKVF